MLRALSRLFVPPRVEVHELLDDADAPVDDVERSLRDLRRFNRLLGGRLAWRRLVKRSGGLSGGESILEIGTGTSDLLEILGDDAIRIGLDLKIDHLLYGRRIGDPSVLRVVGDAKQLPFKTGTVDLIGSSHLFHHFSPRENESILHECLRVSARAVFVTDTRRSAVPWLFVRVLGALRIIGRITRFDAPASVLQGYTIKELRDFARRFRDAGISIHRMVPFRFGFIAYSKTTDDGSAPD